MPSLLRSTVALVVNFVLIGVILAGLLIGAIRLALPFSDLFRSQLETGLSETLGMEVRIGRLELSLVGLIPRLRLQDTRLLDPDSGQPRLELDRLWIDLSPAASLSALAPRIETLTLTGVSLAVKRLSTGELVVTGLEGLVNQDPQAMDFFLGNGSFRLADSDIHWIDEKIGAPPLHLSEVDIQFQNQDERHRIHILARRLDQRQVHLQLEGDLHGAPGRPDDWSGEIYLRWQGDDLGRVLVERLPPGLRLESDAVELESWNRLQGGLLDQSLNRIQAVGLKAWTPTSESGETAPPRLDRVAGLLRWQRLDTGWQLAVDDLAITRDGTRRSAADLEIHFTPGDEGGWTIAGGNQFIDLADARDLLAGLTGLLPQALRRVGEFHPGGGLHDLRFRFTHHPESSPLWAASGRLSDLTLEPHGGIPGIRGLAVEVAADQGRGKLLLTGSDLTLNLPRRFPDPIGLDRAAGEIRWQRETDGAFRIHAQELTLANTDMAASSGFTLRIPAGSASPALELRAEIRDLDLAKIPDYLPLDKLNQGLANWLRHALVGGKIPHGVLSFQGVAAGSPFKDRRSRIEALFTVEDGTLKFHRDWPSLRSLVGEVRFKDRGMQASFSQGRFLDTHLLDGSARIPDLSRAVGVEIRSEAKGPFADGLRVLGETPLRKQFGVLAQILKVEGNARLGLKLDIPFRYQGRKGPLRLAGELDWPDPAILAIPDQDLRLTGLAGKLRFTEHSLDADSITAELWEVPVSLRVDTRTAGKDAHTVTHIVTEGRFPVSVLARQFPSQAWQSLQGETRLALDLAIPGADLGASVPPLNFDLKSDLAGLALQLPKPLGKPAAATRQLHLSGHLVPKQPLHIRGTYGDLGIVFQDQGDHWEAKINAQAFEGGASIPYRPREQPIRVRFKWLDLKDLFGQETQDDRTPADRDHTDPRRAHALALVVDDLQWGGKSLGSLTLNSRAVPEGLEFHEISLDSPRMGIHGQGSWLWTGLGPRSEFSLKAEGPDLQRFLYNLEFGDLCRAESAQIDLDLGWPGAPGRFKATDLEGKIWIRLRDGSLPEVEPGAGRVLGILNLEAIRRRLTLDFNDLFRRGFVFKKISGRIHIENGIASIEDLLIKGTAADIGIVGTTNLRSQEFNQLVTVTPHLGASIAVAGAVAGGPVVGAVVFLAHQVAGDILDKLGRHQYYLSGTWDQPEFQRGGPGRTDAEEASAASAGDEDEDRDENLFLGGDD